jgi:hypothetical protein
MMVFRNWFNEQHSKSTSKKVKAAKRVCAENGKFLGTYAPYGYKKNPGNRHGLVIDENTAPIVRSIYEKRASGLSFRAIAIGLNEEGVISPREYYYQNRNRKNPRRTNQLWNESTISDIIKNEVYVGNTVQGKVGTVSYKNRRSVSKPKDEWIKAEATHEPLIERDLWNRVQEFVHKRYKPRQRTDGEKSLYVGLLCCADCGFKLRVTVSRGNRKDGSEYKYVSYICNNYARSGKAACTVHTIYENVLNDLVARQIRKYAKLAEYNEDRVIEAILSARSNETMSYRAAYQSELESHRKQIAKLDLFIENLYEDKISGVVPESLFKRQVQKYEQDRIDRLLSVETLEQRIGNMKQNTDDASAWVNLIKRYTELETLDSEILLLLIDKIIVSEAKVIGGKRICDIKIIYNYVGDIDKLGLDFSEAVHSPDSGLHNRTAGKAVTGYEQAV